MNLNNPILRSVVLFLAGYGAAKVLIGIVTLLVRP